MLNYFDPMKILAFSKVKNDPIIHFLYDSTYTSCTPIRFSPWINPSVNSKNHEVRKNFVLSLYLGQTKRDVVLSRLNGLFRRILRVTLTPDKRVPVEDLVISYVA